MSESNSKFEFDIYLSGPILSIGQIDNNISVFQEWARKLRGMGYVVFSPPENEPEGLKWDDYLRRDIQYLARCRMVAVLPEWEKSKGANLEVGIAKQLGMEVLKVEEIGPKKDVEEKESQDRSDEILEAAGYAAMATMGGRFESETSNVVSKNETVLEEAMRLVTKDRGNAYGPPEQDFQRTAKMWTGLFQDLLKDGMEFKPEHVALAMILLKASRAMWSEKRDNWVDIPGYAACGHRIQFGGW